LLTANHVIILHATTDVRRPMTWTNFRYPYVTTLYRAVKTIQCAHIYTTLTCSQSYLWNTKKL